MTSTIPPRPSRTVEEVVRALSIELDKYDFTEEQVVLRIGVRAGIELAAEVLDDVYASGCRTADGESRASRLYTEGRQAMYTTQRCQRTIRALLKEPSDV